MPEAPDDARHLSQQLGAELGVLVDKIMRLEPSLRTVTDVAGRLDINKGTLSAALIGSRLLTAEQLDSLFAIADADPETRYRVVELQERVVDADERAKRRPRSLLSLTAPQITGRLVGRVAELDRLDDLLTPDLRTSSPRLVCLYAPPGYGKTRLAVEYFHRHRQRALAGAAIAWWVDAQTRGSVEAGLEALARERGLVARNVTSDEAIKKLRAYLARHRNWLVVFDNADAPEDVEPFFPRGSGSVLVTARHADWAAEVTVLRLDALGPESSMELLEAESGRHDTDLDQLADELWGIPLFLRQAGRALRLATEQGWSVQAYLALLRERLAELLGLGPNVSDYPALGVVVYLHIFDTIEDVATRQLLNTCSFLGPRDVPLALVARGATAFPAPLSNTIADEVWRARAAFELARRGLVEGGPESLNYHEATLDLRRLSLSPADQATTYSATLSVLETALSDELVQHQPRDADRLATHALAALRRPTDDAALHECRTRLFRQARLTRRLVGHLADARAAIHEGHRICAPLPHPSFERGCVLAELGRGVADHWTSADSYDISDALFAEALAELEACDHPDADFQRAGVLNAVARQAHRRAITEQEWREVKRLFWQSIRLFRQARGSDHWTVAQQLSNLAVVHTERGKYRRAEVLLRRAHQIDTASPERGPYHHVTAVRLHNLAFNDYRWAGALRATSDEDAVNIRLDAALYRARAALRPTVKGLGRSHAWYGSRLRMLAQIHEDGARFLRAQRLYEAAEKVMIQAFETEINAEVGHIRGLRADLAEKLGQPERALELAEEALAVNREVHPPDSPAIRKSEGRVERLSNQVTGFNLDKMG